MAACLGENLWKDNGSPAFAMYSPLRSDRPISILPRPWPERISAVVLQTLAYCSGLAVVIAIMAYLADLPKRGPSAAEPVPPAAWIAVERAYPAFALSIPEAGDTPATYAILRHQDGGRKDILTFGYSDGTDPYLTVEIYRPGSEIAAFDAPERDIQMRARQIGPLETARPEEPLGSKFGRFVIEAITIGGKAPRRCAGFAHSEEEPRLRIAGLFCQGGDATVERATLACALDRLTLVSSGSDPNIGAFFAQAELRRSFCGQRSILMAPTPKYPTLWKALDQRGHLTRGR
jgi:hypothetical protein